MTRKALGLASILIVLTMIAAAFLVGHSLPDGAQLPVHWNMRGEVDRFADKWSALLMPPGMTGLLSLLFWSLPALEPRREGLKRSQGLYLWSWAGLLLVMAAVDLVLVSAALGWGVPVDGVIAGAVGLLFVLIGNQLGKSRSMYMVGIRTPWTLASEDVWVKTHRLGGKLFVLAGIAMVLAAIFGPGSTMLGVVVIAATAIAALVPAFYSFLLWRREKGVQPSE